MNDLFEKNIRLAYMVANRWRPRWLYLHSMTQDDIEQAALEALWDCAREGKVSSTIIHRRVMRQVARAASPASLPTEPRTFGPSARAGCRAARAGAMPERTVDAEALDRLIDHEQVQCVKRLLNGLGSRDREIVERHNQGETLKGIGKTIGLTCERCRQIEASALRKMREELS